LFDAVTGWCLIYGVCVQPMRRSVVDVERGSLSMPMGLTHAVSSASTTGAKLGRSVVSEMTISLVYS